jgi:hypothetical protein
MLKFYFNVIYFPSRSTSTIPKMEKKLKIEIKNKESREMKHKLKKIHCIN